jgi:hypothetical protein
VAGLCLRLVDVSLLLASSHFLSHGQQEFHHMFCVHFLLFWQANT